MTTRIDVSVGGGAEQLREKSRQQTEANRLNKLAALEQSRKEARLREGLAAAQGLLGIGADGKPLYGRLMPNRYKPDEPSAHRRSRIVPYYFYRYGPGNSFSVASGDGQQQASGSFSIGSDFTTWATQSVPNPITSLLPADHTFVFVSLITMPSGYVYYMYFSTKVVFELYEPVDPPYQIYNYIRTSVVERAVLFWFPISGNIEDIRVSLPLGGGKACEFAHRRGYTRSSAAMTLQQSTTARYVQSMSNGSFIDGPWISDRLDSFGKVLDQQYTDFANDSVCFQVGRQSAVAITPPSELLNVVDDVLPQTTSGQVGITTTPEPFAASNADWANGEPNYIGYTGSIAITGLTTNTTDVNYPTFTDLCRYGYAVATPPGYDQEAATPFTWFALDSDSTRNQLFNLGVAYHPRILNATLSGGSTTVSSVLKGKYLGIENVSNSYPLVPGAFVYGWGSPSVVPSQSGDPSYGYGYPSYEQTRAQGNHWKARQARIPQSCATYGPGDSTFSQSWSKVLIYDWQNPAFCRQQAARYGL